MRNVLDDNDIFNDCRFPIKYQIPITSKRVEF